MVKAYPEVLYEREFIGYGFNKPNAQWPNGANIAVSFVFDYCMGAEHNLLNGDAGAEYFMTEIAVKGNPFPPPNGKRSDANETIWEYGSREGVPRLLRLFSKYKLPATWTVATRGLEQAPYWVPYIKEAGHEIALGSKRSTDYLQVPPEEEEQHISEALDKYAALVGEPAPAGWLIPRYSNISPLLYFREHQKRGLPLPYSSDSESDELPYWVPSPLAKVDDQPDTGMLVVPVTMDTSDFRFTSKGSGWSSPSDFYEHLVDTFDVLYEEGADGEPKMMTVILHPHIIGHGGRCYYLEKFLQYITSMDKVWIATRESIANHWRATHPYDPNTAFGQTTQVPFE